LPCGLRADAPREIARVHPDDPDWLYVYVYAVCTGWFLLALASGLAMIGLAYLGDRFGGQAARHLGAGVGAGLAFFCLAGMAVASWHSLFAYAARRRYRRTGRLDRRSRRNMKLAALHNGSLFLQVAVGLSLGVHFAS
jgi:hypothetical protein